MGQREIANGVFLTLLGGGVAALIGFTQLSSASSYRVFVLTGALASVAFGCLGLGCLLVTAIERHRPNLKLESAIQKLTRGGLTDAAAVQALRDAARQGRIQVWGRGPARGAPLEPIPADAWGALYMQHVPGELMEYSGDFARADYTHQENFRNLIFNKTEIATAFTKHWSGKLKAVACLLGAIPIMLISAWFAKVITGNSHVSAPNVIRATPPQAVRALAAHVDAPSRESIKARSFRQHILQRRHSRESPRQPDRSVIPATSYQSCAPGANCSWSQAGGVSIGTINQ